jgi:hypothetical protein
MVVITATTPSLEKYKFFVVFLIIGDTLLSFGIIGFLIIKERIQRNKESIIFADLSNAGLPTFKIWKRKNTLIQYYNELPRFLLWKRVLTVVMYAEKIKIKNKENYTTKLYHIADRCIIEVIDQDDFIWWGICEKFEEGKDIFELWHEFGYYYSDKLTQASKVEILNNTMITCAECYDFIPNADKF